MSPGPYYYQRCGTSVSSPARKFEVSENSARELTLISTRQLTITDLLPARVAQGPQGIKILTAWSHAVHGVSFEDVGDRTMT